MKHDFERLAVLTLLSLVFLAQAKAQAASQQNPPASGQAQQQPTETPPYVSKEPNPEARKLEQAINSELQQDPHMAYSRVRVQATDDEIVLSGTVLNATAKQNAEDIAQKHAGGRKISNRIRVNPNVQPGPGI